MSARSRTQSLLFHGSIAVLLAGLAACASVPTEHPKKDGLDILVFDDVPVLEHSDLRLGGFSGLVFEGFSRITGEYDFTTHTDRGPNLDVRKDAGAGGLRPFVLPAFTPRWASFSYNPKKHSLSRFDQILMKKQDGTPMTGLPNTPGADETPIDGLGHRTRYDKMGVDAEGLAKDGDGSYWMCEEYRPSLLHFDKNAHLLERFVPKGSEAATGTPTLPKWYSRRVQNRGFEGVAVDGDQVYGFLQSPLKDDFEVTRILAIEKNTGAPTAEFAYEFEPVEEGRTVVDKIGDAVNIAPGRFLVIEQNSASDERGFHRIYEIDVSDATNLLDRKGGDLSRSALCAEGTPPSKGATSCATPVRKKLIADLVQMGLHGYDKIEGLAVIDAQTLALVNDNDFDVTKTGKPSAFMIVHLAESLHVR